MEVEERLEKQVLTAWTYWHRLNQRTEKIACRKGNARHCQWVSKTWSQGWFN